MNNHPIQLSYFNCNIDIIILLSIITPLLFLTIFILYLIIFSKINTKYQLCDMKYYLLGNNKTCNKMIEQTIDKKMDMIIKNDVKNIVQKSNESFMNHSNNLNLFNDFKEVIYNPLYNFINTNYLAIIDIINLLNEILLLFFFKLCNMIIKFISNNNNIL